MSKHHAAMSSSRWERTRRQILGRDRWRCRDCGRAGRIEVHHVVHLANGGDNSDANLRSLCVGCHQKAHGKAASPWQELIEELAHELAG